MRFRAFGFDSPSHWSTRTVDSDEEEREREKKKGPENAAKRERESREENAETGSDGRRATFVCFRLVFCFVSPCVCARLGRNLADANGRTRRQEEIDARSGFKREPPPPKKKNGPSMTSQPEISNRFSLEKKKRSGHGRRFSAIKTDADVDDVSNKIINHCSATANRRRAQWWWRRRPAAAAARRVGWRETPRDAERRRERRRGTRWLLRWRPAHSILAAFPLPPNWLLHLSLCVCVSVCVCVCVGGGVCEDPKTDSLLFGGRGQLLFGFQRGLLVAHLID